MAFSRTQLGPVQFGRYRLTERLGSGGMAVVYRGFVDGPQGFSRSLVIKKSRSNVSSKPMLLERLSSSTPAKTSSSMTSRGAAGCAER